MAGEAGARAGEPDTPSGPAPSGPIGAAPPRRVLVVCTANQCRSPMAAALLAQAGRGRLDVRSAGTWAADGAPATAEAVRTMAERGIDLAGHRSQSVTRDLVDWADAIVTMTASHRESLVAEFPDAAQKILRLADVDGAGWDVADPIGAGRDAYGATADELGRLVDAGIAKLVETPSA